MSQAIYGVLRAAGRSLVAALLLAAAAPYLALPSPVGNAFAETETKQKPPPRLPASRYVSLTPFILPVFEGQDVVEHMTIVVALELADENRRDEVAHLVPRIRDAMYRELFAMVSFRRKDAPLPEVDQFKVRLYRVVRPIVGEERIKGILVQQAFKRPVR